MYSRAGTLGHPPHLGQYVEAAVAAMNIANSLIGSGKRGGRAAPAPPPIVIQAPTPPPPPPPPPRPTTPGWVWPALGVAGVGTALAAGLLLGGRRR